MIKASNDGKVRKRESSPRTTTKPIEQDVTSLNTIQVCRLCLQVITKIENSKSETVCLRVTTNEDEEFIEAFDKRSEMIKLILPKLNLTVTSSLKICQTCSEELSSSYEFKNACLRNAKVSTEPEAESKTETDVKHATSSGDNLLTTKCELCSGNVEEECSELEFKDEDFLKLILDTCLQELAIQRVSTPCQNCLDSLKDLYNFVIKCINTEENIKDFWAENGDKDKSKVDLFEVFKFVSQRAASKMGPQHRGIDRGSNVALKYEENDSEANEDHSKLGYKINGRLIDGKPTYQCASCIFTTPNSSVMTNHVEMHYRCRTKTIKCAKCSFRTSLVSRLKIHENVHKDPSEIQMYKCSICPFETRHKCYIKSHEDTHKSPTELERIKCPYCSFESRLRSVINKHKMSHKAYQDTHRSETLKCRFCPYETFWLSKLKKHELNHTAERQRCKFCLYSTRNESLFNNHVRRKHEGQTEVVHKCDKCKYTTRYKEFLEQHVLLHKQPYEVTIFKCFNCNFETRVKYRLAVHIKRKHTDFNLKCSVCPFETKNWNSMNEHKIRHKDISEVKAFKCPECPYQAKLKRYLNQHMKVHQDPSETKYLMCDVCSYRTKRRNYLRDHMKTHGKELDKGKGKLYKNYNRFGLITKSGEQKAK